MVDSKAERRDDLKAGLWVVLWVYMKVETKAETSVWKRDSLGSKWVVRRASMRAAVRVESLAAKMVLQKVDSMVATLDRLTAVEKAVMLAGRRVEKLEDWWAAC